MMQILESRYKEAEGNLRKQIEKSASISKCYQEYAARYLLCSYASSILQGAYRVKRPYFPSGICKPNGKNMEGDSAALYSVS